MKRDFSFHVNKSKTPVEIFIVSQGNKKFFIGFWKKKCPDQNLQQNGEANINNDLCVKWKDIF